MLREVECCGRLRVLRYCLDLSSHRGHPGGTGYSTAQDGPLATAWCMPGVPEEDAACCLDLSSHRGHPGGTGYSTLLGQNVERRFLDRPRGGIGGGRVDLRHLPTRGARGTTLLRVLSRWRAQGLDPEREPSCGGRSPTHDENHLKEPRQRRTRCALIRNRSNGHSIPRVVISIMQRRFCCAILCRNLASQRSWRRRRLATSTT